LKMNIDYAIKIVTAIIQDLAKSFQYSPTQNLDSDSCSENFSTLEMKFHDHQLSVLCMLLYVYSLWKL